MRLTPDFETLRRTCDFKTLRQTPVRRPPDATFQNIVSDARQTPARRSILKLGVRHKISKNHAPDVIFCDHASDVQYESGYVHNNLYKTHIDNTMRQGPSVSPFGLNHETDIFSTCSYLVLCHRDMLVSCLPHILKYTQESRDTRLNMLNLKASSIRKNRIPYQTPKSMKYNIILLISTIVRGCIFEVTFFCPHNMKITIDKYKRHPEMGISVAFHSFKVAPGALCTLWWWILANS